MCENNCNENNGKDDISKARETLNMLYQENNNLYREIDGLKVNVERFQALYMCALGYINKALQEQDTGVLSEAIQKLGEIEMKYIKG